MKISEMKVNSEITGVRLLMTEVEKRSTNTKPPREYLNATFFDGVDTINGKLWNFTGELPEKNSVYRLDGKVDEYQNKKQLNIKMLMWDADQKAEEFMPSCGEDPEKLYEEAMHLISLIFDDKLKALVHGIYTRYADLIKMSTSAKGVHHVGVGGNLQHSLEVYNFATSIAEQRLFHDPAMPIAFALVEAGALLHDIGKILTYEYDNSAIDLTMRGKLHDHIINGITILLQENELQGLYSPRFMGDPLDQLIHIIASHHGKLEYGSPVTPITAEAHIVHFADMISATLNTVALANRKAIDEKKEFTDRIFTQGNREHLTQHFISGLFSPGEQ